MNIIKAIINDFKTDIEFLKKVVNGEYKFPYTLKEVLDIRPILKDTYTWIFFMIIIAAVFTGMFVSAKYYQFKANEEIIEAQSFVDTHCSNTDEYYSRFPKVDFTDIVVDINKIEANT